MHACICWLLLYYLLGGRERGREGVIDSSGSIPSSVARHLEHKTWIKIAYTLTGLAYMLATSYSCNDKLTMTMYLQMTDNKVRTRVERCARFRERRTVAAVLRGTSRNYVITRYSALVPV